MVAMVVLAGCRDDNVTPEPYVPPTPVGHTVLIYMVADNNLNSYAVSNLNALKSAYSDQYDTKFVIFYNQWAVGNNMYELVGGANGEGELKKLLGYSSDLNPCSPEVLSTVIADCREYAPAEKYSLVLWSHGTGWLPQGMHPAKSITTENYQAVSSTTTGATYTFGYDSSGNEMEIHDLVNALPTDLVFEYIHFDACHMASIEVAHQLRHRARYMVASAAEIMAAGFDYQNGFQAMATADVGTMVEIYYNYYAAQSGVSQTATIAAIDLSKMDELATEFSKLVALGGSPTASQQYGRNQGTYYNYSDLMWDLGDLATQTWGAEVAADFLLALDQAVPHKAATEYLFPGAWSQIKVDTHCGLSAYIPLQSQPQTLEIYTQNYSWAQATEFYKLAQ